MPLTAFLDGRVIDATACDETQWAAVYKTGAPLECRDCRGSMHAKISPTGLAFFAHKRKPDDCAWGSESAEHRALKKLLAELARAVGADAELEAAPAPGDNGGWRADVLVTTPAGRRVALEAQLASMTVEEGAERTERYARDGIATMWVTTKHAHWISQLPSARLVMGEDGVVMADRGMARLSREDGHAWFQPAGTVDFARVLAGVLQGRVVPVEAGSAWEHAERRSVYVQRAIWLVAADERDEYEEARRRERLRAKAEDDAERRHAQRIKALYERQVRVAQHAAEDALAAPEVERRLWLGVPPTWWREALPVQLLDVAGSEATGQGAAIWTGADATALRLWAVVCPVAGQCTASLGTSWRKRGVRVYVETEREAARVADALGWARGALQVRPPTAVKTGS